jgi:hypothetical protein
MGNILPVAQLPSIPIRGIGAQQLVEALGRGPLNRNQEGTYIVQAVPLQQQNCIECKKLIQHLSSVISALHI